MFYMYWDEKGTKSGKVCKEDFDVNLELDLDYYMYIFFGLRQ
jgi:hypothetical protein